MQSSVLLRLNYIHLIKSTEALNCATPDRLVSTIIVVVAPGIAASTVSDRNEWYTWFCVPFYLFDLMRDYQKLCIIREGGEIEGIATATPSRKQYADCYWPGRDDTTTGEDVRSRVAN